IAPRMVAGAQRPQPAGISAEALTRRIDAFLGSRGYKPGRVDGAAASARSDSRSTADQTTASPTHRPLDFVCEDDVRQAIRAGVRLVIAERAIVTPAARELAEQHRVLTI